MARIISLFIGVFFFFSPVYGQVEDSLDIILPVLEVYDSTDNDENIICRYPILNRSVNITEVRGLPSKKFSSYYNLADLLQDEHSIFIKSYGQGSLATSSMRGTGSSHTAVLWNGFNLQSSMNGTLDLSLIPISFVDDARVSKSGASTRFGSGAIGGAIVLNNPIYFRKGLDIALDAKVGSFENYNESLSVKWSNGKFYNKTRVFHHAAKNDFAFQNTSLFGKPVVNQTNAAFEQYGILQENAILINKNQSLDAKLWYQNSHRALPPSMLQAESKAFQDDAATRLLAHWQYIGKKTAWHVSSAYFDEYIRYSDEQISLDDTSRATTWTNKLETYFYLPKKQTIKIGGQYTHLNAFSEGYDGTFVQNQLAFFAEYSWRNPTEKYEINMALREEVVDGDMKPLAGHLMFNYQFHKNWSGYLNTSRSFRLPTFNDLYWSPGGNPNLEPETSWSEDIGIRGNFKIKKTRISTQFSIFNKNITNWILWQPTGPFWSPINILEVWSRGVDMSSSVTWQLKKGWRLKLGGNYEFVKSTNQKVADNSGSSLDKQLIYVPFHKGNINLQLNYRKWLMRYSQHYTGQRFTTTDNNGSLDHYSTGDWMIRYHFYKKARFHWHFKLNNVWNVDYQVIESRPMPGRNFQTGITIIFNK